MNRAILENTLYAIEAAKAAFAADRPPAAIVMHPNQYRLMCDVIDGQKAQPLSVNHLPIWLASGVSGPCVVDQRTLMFLKMIGAVQAR